MNELDQFAKFRLYHEKEQLIEEVIKVFYSSFLSSAESVAIDCGCHNGLHTFPLIKCCKQVIGVDAHARMSAELSERIRGSNIGNCKIVHAAIQDDESLESVTFFVADEHLGRSSLTRLWNAIDDKVVYRPVVSPATTLDRLVQDMGIPRVDFIKLDLEGGEYKALRGAEKILKRDLPIFVMENSMHAAKQGNFHETDPFEYLTSLNYVLLAPNGKVLRREELFPFWYVFGVPALSVDKYRQHLINAYASVCSSRNIL